MASNDHSGRDVRRRRAAVRSVLEKYPELAPNSRHRSAEETNNYISDLSRRISRIQHAAKIIQQHQIEIRNRNKNRHARQNKLFNIGEFVLRIVDTEQRHNKLEPTATGPYKVVRKVSPAVYRLESIVQPGDMLDVHERELMSLVLDETYPKEAILRSAQHDFDEYPLEKISGHSGTNANNLKFIVRFVGETFDRSLTYTQLIGNELLEMYIESHEELKDIIRNIERRRPSRVQDEELQSQEDL